MPTLTVDTDLINATLRELRRHISYEDIPQRRRAPIQELRGHLERVLEDARQERMTGGTVERDAMECQTCGIRVSRCGECGDQMARAVVQEELPVGISCERCEAIGMVYVFDTASELDEHNARAHSEWTRGFWPRAHPTWRDNGWRCGAQNENGVRCTRQRQHLGAHRVRPANCGRCRMDFDSLDSFGGHILEEHNGNTDEALSPLYFCECGEAHVTEHALNEHIRYDGCSAHPDE